MFWLGKKMLKLLPAAVAKRLTKHVSADSLGVYLMDALLFLLLRIGLIDVAISEVRGEKYQQDITPPYYPIDPSQAELIFKIQREDSDHTDDKVRQLLTLASSLVTVILGFARDAEPHWLLVSAVSLLITSVLLSIATLAVRVSAVPTLENSENDSEAHSWARDLWHASAINRSTHRFRVDCYRAARRYFVVALILVAVLASNRTTRQDPAQELVRVLHRAEKRAAAPAGQH